MDLESEVKAARDKLAARFGDATQIGGKGKLPITSFIRTRRHPKKKEEAC